MVDRALIRAVLVMLVVNGITFEGIGALANVASTWLLLLVGWCAVAVRESRATSTPVGRGPRARRVRERGPATR